MIKLKDITKYYLDGDSKNIIFSKLNFNCKDSTINTFIGHSGIGKTTLLNIIGLIDKPNNGQVFLNDNKINFNSDLSNLRLFNYGYVFQDDYLLPEFTVYENLMIPGLLKNKRRNKIDDDVNSLLSEFKLNKLKNKYPTNISRGEAQRVSILRSVINRPRIIIADEPTSNLDDSNANSVLELFEILKNKFDMTIIIATHDKRFLKISDKNYKLHNKKIENFNCE